jgi:hypothetical protein
LQTLPRSPPDELRQLGYDVREIGEGERILHSAIIERFTNNAVGTLGILTEGSTQPVVAMVHHPGISKVKRCALKLMWRWAKAFRDLAIAQAMPDLRKDYR